MLLMSNEYATHGPRTSQEKEGCYLQSIERGWYREESWGREGGCILNEENMSLTGTDEKVRRKEAPQENISKLGPLTAMGAECHSDRSRSEGLAPSCGECCLPVLCACSLAIASSEDTALLEVLSPCRSCSHPTADQHGAFV